MDRIKITVDYWNNTDKPDTLILDYPYTDLSIEEFITMFKTILTWLTFYHSTINKIWAKDYR